MTVIVLLDSTKNPHIVADTLLTAEGSDPTPGNQVWLPAQGFINSNGESNGENWHISRLGRKTFALPDKAGLLSFAGDCRTAFQLWDKLSDYIHYRKNYDNGYRLTKEQIDAILSQLPNSHLISVLGSVINEEGNLTPIVHQCRYQLNTQNFGVCYIAGSGSDIAKGLIENKDRWLSSIGGWKPTISVSATENLAQEISTTLLHLESDISNGSDPDSSLKKNCGGFYEWYSVKPEGIKPENHRIDLTLSLEGDNIFITRLYYTEQFRIPSDDPDSTYSEKYPLFVASLLSDYIELSRADIIKNHLLFGFSGISGTIIGSALARYDPHSPDREKVEGPIPEDALRSLFLPTSRIKRVNVILQDLHGDTTIQSFISPQNLTDHFYAELSLSEENFTLIFDGKIKDYIAEKLTRRGGG